jgi:ABC-2 type transport system ATP-binding protein
MDSLTLQVDRVTKQFGEFTAVDDLSFEVSAGRVFGFLGPNGAGKTTTLRMIVGITAPDSGSIEFQGCRISDLVKNRIGYLPEERGLYKKLKVAEQLRYFAALKGVPGSEADRRIDWWLSRMNLSQWKNAKTTDLSKGMSQKIQFISAVLHDPDLLILDEPFSGLDPVNVEFMLEVLDEFKKKDKTVIFSTHLMETAERLCSDILLINRSRKVLSGDLAEIKRGFARNVVKLRLSGGDGILSDRSLVSHVNVSAHESEAVLAEGVTPDELLRRLVDARASITRFEQVAPSLNDIFIEQIGGSNA